MKTGLAPGLLGLVGLGALLLGVVVVGVLGGNLPLSTKYAAASPKPIRINPKSALMAISRNSGDRPRSQRE